MNERSFRHEAVLYGGDDGFLAGTLPLIHEAVAAHEPVLAMVSERRAALLHDALGGPVPGVHFEDMATVGRNPARIIPAWRDFVDRHGAPGRMLRGIGEPIWAGRTPAELAECHLHESLLNRAFAGVPFRLLCPYDVDALDPTVVRDAAENHPVLVRGHASHRSPTFRGGDGAAAPFSLPLLPAPPDAAVLAFGTDRLDPVRRFIEDWCERAQVGGDARDVLVLAASELASNSIVHGGGRGTLLLWNEDGSARCEVRDAGRIREPMVGRERPPHAAERGRGLWLVNQLCDLVQIHSGPQGSTVRVHVGLG